MAGLARLLPQNVQPYLRSLDGLPEIDIQPVFEIGSALRLNRACFCRAEKLAEDITKAAATRSNPPLFPRLAAVAAGDIREIESAEILGRPAPIRTPGPAPFAGILSE